MDEKRISAMVENIEIYLETSVKGNETILKEIKDLKNDPKGAQILNQASERINSLSDELSLLVSKQKQQIENFNPVVEVKNYTVDVRNPLMWFLCCAFIVIIGTIISYYFVNKANQGRDEWKGIAADRRDVSYKYRYLRLFGSPGTVQEISKLDIDYEVRYRYYDSLAITRERLLKQREDLEQLAKIKAAEAKALERKADSLRNK